MKVSNLKTATVIMLVLQAFTENTLRALESWNIGQCDSNNFLVEIAARRLDALHVSLSKGEELDEQTINTAFPGMLKWTRPGGIETYTVFAFVQNYLQNEADPLHVGNRIYSRLASALHRSFADFGMPKSVDLAQAFRDEKSERSVKILGEMGRAIHAASVDDSDFVQHLLEVIKAIQQERANADGKTPLNKSALEDYDENARVTLEARYYMRFCRYSLSAFAEAICVVLPVLMLACGDACENTKEVLHAMHFGEVVAEYCDKARSKLIDRDVHDVAVLMIKQPWDYFYGFIDSNDERVYDCMAVLLMSNYAVTKNVVITVGNIALIADAETEED